MVIPNSTAPFRFTNGSGDTDKLDVDVIYGLILSVKLHVLLPFSLLLFPHLSHPGESLFTVHGTVTWGLHLVFKNQT